MQINSKKIEWHSNGMNYDLKKLVLFQTGYSRLLQVSPACLHFEWQLKNRDI
ncbi:hypothetical protein D1BOALGB6SA_9683 [Olavius sp. associated proteobacterium Delta 1]|nr:hypothetical protein D1BOALGB6SA_9683 [Olavius sp. associated proteobacterium Delta 1]